MLFDSHTQKYNNFIYMQHILFDKNFNKIFSIGYIFNNQHKNTKKKMIVL
jgi:hypothetical protein